jgi:hypothetical protein
MAGVKQSQIGGTAKDVQWYSDTSKAKLKPIFWSDPVNEVAIHYYRPLIKEVDPDNISGEIARIIQDATEYGAFVEFNQSFIDVAAFTVTPNGTNNDTAIGDFHDTPYPKRAAVYRHDAAGDRMAGKVSWSARGY